MKKLVIDCRLRDTLLTEAIRRRVEGLNEDLNKYEGKTTLEMRKEVVKCRKELYEAQKNCDED